MIIQGKGINPDDLDHPWLIDGPVGKLLDNGRFIVMSISDAILLKFVYIERYFGGNGNLALVPVDRKYLCYSGMMKFEVYFKDGSSKILAFNTEAEFLAYMKENEDQTEGFMEIQDQEQPE